MYKKILIPLDFTETDAQQRALSMATEVAKSHGAELHAVSIGSNLPDAAVRTESKRSLTLNALVEDFRLLMVLKRLPMKFILLIPAQK
ncbi:universal stress protein [Aliamphritea ceti]|uniref:universal stress protein n=1 Tax=Aliamphritea ceti TaxID=1524258 RepID=UPI0021C39E9C|nr:universal stress protein [Aliamphritea ceti]